jgi:predicted nuclease with TOPRIM domain
VRYLESCHRLGEGRMLETLPEENVKNNIETLEKVKSKLNEMENFLKCKMDNAKKLKQDFSEKVKDVGTIMNENAELSKEVDTVLQDMKNSDNVRRPLNLKDTRKLPIPTTLTTSNIYIPTPTRMTVKEDFSIVRHVYSAAPRSKLLLPPLQSRPLEDETSMCVSEESWAEDSVFFY